MTTELMAETSAEFVLKLRNGMRVTQLELAKKTWTDRALIARLELGREPRPPTLRRLVASLGGRLELIARFERPMEAMADDFIADRLTLGNSKTYAAWTGTSGAGSRAAS